MNRYANSRIGIITHSCDIVFSHAVNRACFTGPTRHCAATRRGTMQRDSMLADRAKKIRATKTGRSNYKRVHVHAHARAHACRDDIRCKDTEEKSQSNWQVWNMWPRPYKNIGPPSSLLNVYRSGAKPTHDRIFQLRVVVCVMDSSSIGRTDLCVSGIATCEQVYKLECKSGKPRGIK